MGMFNGFSFNKIFGSSGSGKLPGMPKTNNRTIAQSVVQLFVRDKITETDYSENNYDLFRAIYHNSVVNGSGAEHIIAAALGKPVINIAASHVIGKGFKISLDNPTKDKLITEVEEELNSWAQDNMRTLFNLTKHSYRDGDSYVHINEYGELKEIDAKGVTEIIDPLSGATIGFDVMREVEMVDSSDIGNTSSVQYIYVKQYRTDSIRIYRYRKDSPENISVIWEKVYTVNGAVDIPRDEENNSLGISSSQIQERKLAIQAFHNEPEAESVYGNSDYQNLLALFENYSGLIKEGTRGAKYNAVPTPVIMGLQDASKTMAENEYRDKSGRTLSPAEASLDAETSAMYSQSGTANTKRGIEWGSDKVLYLSKGADAKFITGSGFMSDLGNLLEYYFYLFVQGSETPEYVLGTAVSSSKASTETQSPVFEKKIERKQMELKDFITGVVETIIERKAMMSDPMYQYVREAAPKINIVFPSLDIDDMQVMFSTVQWVYEAGLITSERVLELLLSDKIKDIPEELKTATSEAKKRAEEAPAASDRIVKELFSKANTEKQDDDQTE